MKEKLLYYKNQLQKSMNPKILLLLIMLCSLAFIIVMLQKQQILRSRASINLSEAFEIKDAAGNVVKCALDPTNQYVCDVDTDTVSIKLTNPSVFFDSENGSGCNGNDCYAPASSQRVSLTDMYSNDNSKLNSFSADCKPTTCVYPTYKIPYIYDQTNVSIPESEQYFDRNIDPSERICIENTKNNVGSSACGPTSLAMVAEAFNGRDNNNQTANNLTRYFLYKKIMDCERGTVDYIDNSGTKQGLLKYLELATQEEVVKTLQVSVLDRVEGTFDELEKWYKDTGYPIWTGIFYFRNNGTKTPHYATIAGISDNFVWLADPYKPEGQTVLKIPKADFKRDYYRDKFWKIAPKFSDTDRSVIPSERPDLRIQSVCQDVCYSTDLRTNVGKDSLGKCNASVSSTSHLCTTNAVGSKMRCNGAEYQCVDRGLNGGLFWTGTGY